ncbi:hypothetical protein GCM10009001_02860 [Virgibacillus siamensis]|uniref:Uncharacterized protein n=1 Tax=Virgibacillus siamensis TaxID=480071 RepID=A0ABN1FGJ5_9BACI
MVIFGILLVIFVDAYSHWRGFGVARTSEQVGLTLLKLENTSGTFTAANEIN